ncbi:SDR family oxidoreductase [Sporomusa termitida]|uniref:Glucose 1-dehydrogenase 4 n=1 Tax=Sporomusa termitida TaxID=2377 RepID=A0A517DSG9_9FIRM|nr:SDR family oxidoreductase [Sporomusa termitida]QDR80303.1 Glucose 1-dehydrogenase 4 [Sporomusa termitida]
MKKVCVITGGGSGMGLATAKILGKNNYIIIAGRTINKLQNALEELSAEGIEAESFACDISKYASVAKLAAHAREIGVISSVIQAAGLSPHMSEAKTIMEANALGTINMHEAFYGIMEEGSCMLDVASMSGYLVPRINIPQREYKYSRINKETFINKMIAMINVFPQKLRSSMAYGISKNFVIWYAKTDAARFGQKGIRVISVSPGSFQTPMGELEKESVESHIKFCAIKRLGRVEEIADLFAFCVSDKAGYLTGVDILCDGGCVAGMKNK